MICVNKLIINVKDPLQYMAQFKQSSFHLIFMEPPFNTGLSEWTYEMSDEQRYIDSKYGEYISHLVECSYNLLHEDGFMCFLITSTMNNNYNYQMILEHFFKSIIQVSLMDKRKNPWSDGLSPHSIIYFCSKDDAFRCPNFREMDVETNYPAIDKDGRRYRKVPAYRVSSQDRYGMNYSWHDIELRNDQSWVYNKETMDQEYEKGNILIEGNQVFRKKYQDETFVPVNTVWENNNGSYISERNLKRILDILSVSGQDILCPFERDGMFSMCADNSGSVWTSIYVPSNRVCNYIERIPRSHYQTIIGEEHELDMKFEDVIKSSNEIQELKNKLELLQSSVKAIQEEIGIYGEDKTELIIEKIHEKIREIISDQSITTCIPEVKDWLMPHWDKLENESKQFLPTGAFLFRQFEKQEGADYAPAMIEYCRTLEKEMFEKLFCGYIQNVIERQIDLRTVFSDSFSDKDSSIFAEFLESCVVDYPFNPGQWHFELGKMAYVLTRVLAKRQRVSIYRDFREYLNSAFDTHFFGEHFSDQLSVISRLRNECAHPAVVNQEKVSEGRELIRKKLNSILAYYN